MSNYVKPDVFTSITIAEAAVQAVTPSKYPAMVAPHFFVAYKEEVVEAGKNYYTGLSYESKDISYPGLPLQSNPNESTTPLKVDVGDLTANANNAQGVPFSLISSA